MASQAITHSLPLPRWQSNRPIFGVPSIVRLHEYKPQKTWCLRSMFKKKSSGYGDGDIINLKWDTDDSEEESSSAVVASENYKKTQNGETLEEDGSLDALMKLLLVEAAVQKDMIAAQQQMILELQRRVSPSSESTAAQDQRILDLQRRVTKLEFNAAQQQMIADLQRKVARLELDAEFKYETKTPPTETHAQSKSERMIPSTEIHAQSKSKTKTLPIDIHVQSKSKTKIPPTENFVTDDGETVEQREKNPLVYFPASSDKEEHTGVEDDYTMVAMEALQRMQLDLNAESKSKTKTTPTENLVSGDGETDEKRERNPQVYLPASSDKEKHTGEDDYTMVAMEALQRMQLVLNAESKSKMKTPPTENFVTGDGEAVEQCEKNPLVYIPASSDKEEHIGVEDDYAMAAMEALQRMHLDLNAESKSETKTPSTENLVSGDGERDEQRERNQLMYIPASSDKEKHTGEDDYTMVAMEALQRLQLDLSAESKSKKKTPTENRVTGDGETVEQYEKNPPVYFPASSDKEEHTGVKDDYAMVAMEALQRIQLDLNAESKSETKTPSTENHVSGDGETGEQREGNPLVYLPASSDKEKHTGEDDYAMVAMEALQRMQLDLNAESKSKMGTSLKTPQTETLVLSDGEADEERLSSDEDEQHEKTPLVNFSASSDGEEQSGFKDDDYTMAVMNVLLRTQLEQNAESKSKMETPLKTPQTEIQLSDSETDEEHHSSEIDEQRERTQLMNLSATSDEKKHAGYKNDEYTNTVMNQISKPHKMRFSRKPSTRLKD